MASLLRQIVAGPRARHDETGLDLCYVTSNIIATSGPSQTYPQLAYRNPLDSLVAFLDRKHADRWAIWEFRAEGTGYPDAAVYHRIRHYPWPDHHPPPFRLVPMILASMRQWLAAPDAPDAPDGPAGVRDPTTDGGSDRVVVVHCKAGKGRSGTMACSYLIAECGWTPQQALDRFTARRMRPNFGSGITIPSQLRWIGYVDRWTRHGKPAYADRAVEIMEVRVWGLRHGVKLAVEGYVDEGKKIKVFHMFKTSERHVIEGGAPGGGGLIDLVYDMAGARTPKGGSGGIARPMTDGLGTGAGNSSSDSSTSRRSSPTARPHEGDPSASRLHANQKHPPGAASESTPALGPWAPAPSPQTKPQPFSYAAEDEPGGQSVVFRPEQPVRVPNSDVNISIERHNKTTASMGLTMVTSVAHVWFNAYFEGDGPERGGQPGGGGVFTIEWDKLDGIKGSSQKGSRAADRIAVVWRAVEDDIDNGKAAVPPAGEPAAEAAAGDVPQMRPADWKGGECEDPDAHRRLGLRREDPESAGVSRANSFKGVSVVAGCGSHSDGDSDDALVGVKASGPEGGPLEDEKQ